MKGGHFFRLNPGDFIKLPPGSEIFMLPGRSAVGYDTAEKRFTKLDGFAVAAFISPGFTATYNSPYKEKSRQKLLPLFAYAAAAFYKGEFYATAMRTDRERRQDLRCMDMEAIRKNAGLFRKIFPHNRLLSHLRDCALAYGCPAAKNFFLKRYEAPLPTSPLCNARCAGCISYQPEKKCPVTQPRIKFIPTAEEVSEIALFHIHNVKDPVVSFGQGCEGEPLLVPDVLEKSVKIIRARTGKGIINLNTNASRQDIISRLFDAGMDSMRVSLNSAREIYYNRYYRPNGYTFKDVMKSVKAARVRGGFVSVNYLTMPGFTDLKDEHLALKHLVKTYGIDMIQWRNLNFDPLAYFRVLRISPDRSSMLGIKDVIRQTMTEFPRLMTGYFNPSKLRIRRHRKY
ncbi:MAG: radical SAM protein [Candidatus Omnitrophota bacterium]|nr:radical SAM protein [Candidatus Omnitrophota bacterium]